jgi:hypothetical protein
MNRQSKRVAMLLGAGGLATMIVPSGTRADSANAPVHRVDLTFVCLSAGSVRIAASNDSPLPVQVTAAEVGLATTASDELLALFPLLVPASSHRVTTRELAVPAHRRGAARHGLLRAFHGTLSPRRWTDANGLTYRSTGGVDLQNAKVCDASADAFGSETGTTGTTTTSASPNTSTGTASPTSSGTLPTTSSAATDEPSSQVDPVTAASSPPAGPASPATSGVGGATDTPSTTAPSRTTTTTSPIVTTAPAPTVPATTAPATTAPATTTTAAPGPFVEVEPISVRSTTNSQLAPMAFDHRSDTAFVTQMEQGSPPTWAWVSADLGRAVALSRIEWMWTTAGSADDASIRTSTDGSAWTVLAPMIDGPPGQWMGHNTPTTARYVRFYFRNPRRDAQLGNLAEVRMLAAPDAAGLADPTAPAAPYGRPSMETRDLTPLPSDPGTAPTGTLATIVASNRSSNSAVGSSRRALDGDATTAWRTSMAVAPWTGWVSFDLGVVSPLRTVQWMISQPDAADSYRVQLSADGSSWTTVAIQSNPATADQWLTLPVEVDARHVRFYFRNPGLDANVGQLSEVRIFVA